MPRADTADNECVTTVCVGEGIRVSKNLPSKPKGHRQKHGSPHPTAPTHRKYGRAPPSTLRCVKTQMRASQNQNQARLSGRHGFLSKTKPRSRRLLQVTSGCGFLYMGEAYDRPLFSGREDRTKEGKKDEKEGKTTIPCTQKFVRIYLLSVRCWKPLR